MDEPKELKEPEEPRESKQSKMQKANQEMVNRRKKLIEEKVKLFFFILSNFDPSLNNKRHCKNLR